MPYFSPAFLSFFADLEANNDRDWFKANKATYEQEVKAPFHQLVEQLIDRVQVIDPSVVLTPKEAIFRIYRDTRFSKDKTPYKLNTSAIIASGGRKGRKGGGMYVELSHNDARVYGGAYMPDKEALYRIREAIARDISGFRALIEAPAFVEHFGTIHGDKNKRLPAEFREAAEEEPLLFNKSFYYFQKFDPQLILTDALPDKMIEAYLAGKPVGDFLRAAMEG